MYRRVFAFDYDGTLAESGRISQAVIDALWRLRRAGYALFLATGRNYRSIPLEPIQDLFHGIVWENGAVLSRASDDGFYLPFGQVDPQLIDALEATGIPLDRGQAIVSSWAAHDETIWQVLGEFAGDATVSHNKGAIMILPPGVSKGIGLERLLRMCGYSPRNLICFGDAENDLSMFQIAETTVAVGDAVEELKAVADHVAEQPGPKGILETLERYWLQTPPEIPQLHNRQTILIGYDREGAPAYLAGSMLASGRVGIFGDSGSGKSWLTGLMVEGMHLAGYQMLLLDPEGDHRNLSSLPGVIALTGNQSTLTNPALIPMLLEEPSISLILDLSSYPVEARTAYVAEILTLLHPLRENKFRPHWIVLEEAQHFMPLVDGGVEDALRPMLPDGGWAFVTYRPDRMSPSVREGIDHYLVARLQNEEAYQSLAHLNRLPSAEALAQTPTGSFWLCGQRVVRLKTGGRRVPHVRHLYKYLDYPVPHSKRFYFAQRVAMLG